MLLLNFGGAAEAGPNLITNGDFEITTQKTPTQIGFATTSLTLSDGLTTNQNTVAGWTNVNGGYNFLFSATSPTSYGSNGNVSLYTSANGGTGGNASLASPTGGNFVANDGAFQTTAITQTVTGLTVGTNYSLTFYWAAAQQTGFSGATTEAWKVTFGNQVQSTETITTASKGFSSWRPASMLFTATAATQTLAFLAAGTPSGQPPFSLLDSVSLVDAPEPASWSLVALGLLGLTVLGARRRRVRPT